MDASHLPDWDNEVEVDFSQRKKFGSDNGLMELLWKNGEIVLNSQRNKKPCCDSFKSKPIYRHGQLENHVMDNSKSLNQAEETVSWIHSPYPVDDSFEDFCSNFMYDNIPSEVNKCSGLFESGNLFKFGASNADHCVIPSLQLPESISVSLQPQSFGSLDHALGNHVVADAVKASNLEIPEKTQGFGHMKQGAIDELSVMTFGSSHCGSNQVASSSRFLSRTLPAGVGLDHAHKMNSLSDDCTERESLEQDLTSSSGGSFCKTSNLSNAKNCHKRKIREMNHPECHSDATELQSASGNKSSQKFGTTRRTRVAEVHNLSERKRRDKINEKMKALQELIPHSSKSDKASMLDDAIEYMKSLQSQIQFMWMGSGMAQIVLPGMQRYMSQIGMGIVPTALPPIHNLMRMARLPQMYQAMTVAPASNQTTVGLSPVMNSVNYQNQMQNSSFNQQYANYMSLFSMQNTSQPMNHYNFSPHSSQLNRVLAAPGNVSGSIA